MQVICSLRIIHKKIVVDNENGRQRAREWMRDTKSKSVNVRIEKREKEKIKKADIKKEKNYNRKFKEKMRTIER